MVGNELIAHIIFNIFLLKGFSINILSIYNKCIGLKSYIELSVTTI